MAQMSPLNDAEEKGMRLPRKKLSRRTSVPINDSTENLNPRLILAKVRERGFANHAELLRTPDGSSAFGGKQTQQQLPPVHKMSRTKGNLCRAAERCGMHLPPSHQRPSRNCARITPLSPTTNMYVVVCIRLCSASKNECRC